MRHSLLKANWVPHMTHPQVDQTLFKGEKTVCVKECVRERERRRERERERDRESSMCQGCWNTADSVIW